ncbi:MAG: hypothetical protein A3H69_04130 [Candidatus Sungbacteria bacterium RIFCSPLOWO2_02_FULL_47_9]|nr:MAG: hypothetical protein A3H69_04130 [Candidatus Sungbacteria bacterium RIFCSPLOWO2_02_FULL_47_9]
MKLFWTSLGYGIFWVVFEYLSGWTFYFHPLAILGGIFIFIAFFFLIVSRYAPNIIAKEYRYVPSPDRSVETKE